MKIARFVLKIVAAAMALMDLFYTVADKMEEKKAECRFASEYDDYEDFDM